MEQYLRCQKKMQIISLQQKIWKIRLSLIHISAYSELVEMDVLWPDFTRDDLDAAIMEFNRRSRRFGGL